MDLVEDQVLVEKYRETGDLSHLSTLWMRHHHKVLGKCMQMLKNEEQAKDASSEIFESLIKKLKNHQVTHFNSWLYMVSHNHCLQIIRKNKGVFHEDIQSEKNLNRFMEKPDFTHLTDEEAERDNQVHECLDSLKEEQKLCLTLFFFYEHDDGKRGLRYKEIVQRTGFEDKKVKSYIQNGKRNMAICLSGKGITGLFAS